MFLLETLIQEEESVSLQVLVDGVPEVLGEVTFDVCVDCSSGEGQHGHFPGFEVFLLSVELVGDYEGEWE